MCTDDENTRFLTDRQTDRQTDIADELALQETRFIRSAEIIVLVVGEHRYYHDAAK